MTQGWMRDGCRAACLAAMALVLAACALPKGGRGVAAPSGDAAGVPTASQGARRGAYYLDDGPGAHPPFDLASIPDAVPRPEPLLPRTMRPYSVFGRTYTPMTQVEPFRERGIATWYGRRYHGQPTSSGERYDMYAMSAAHPTLPIPSYARVSNVANGRSVVVRVNDRGPFLRDRVIDLSYTAAAKLGYVEAGSAEVDVELVTQFDGAAPTPAAVPSVSSVPSSVSSVPPLALTVVSLPTVDAAPAVSGEAARSNVDTAASAPATVRADTTSPPAIDPPARAIPTTPMAASPGAPARGFWLQFGAFDSLANARRAMTQLAHRLEFLGVLIDVRQDGALYKVQAGPWDLREEAVAAAARVRARTGLSPFATPR